MPNDEKSPCGCPPDLLAILQVNRNDTSRIFASAHTLVVLAIPLITPNSLTKGSNCLCYG